MQPEIIIALFAGGVSLVVGLVNAWQHAQESKRNAAVLEASAVVLGYDGLVKSLQEQAEINERKIKSLREQAEENECKIETLRTTMARMDLESLNNSSRWSAERQGFQDQIRELQAENKKLYARIDDLQKIIDTLQVKQ